MHQAVNPFWALRVSSMWHTHAFGSNLGQHCDGLFCNAQLLLMSIAEFVIFILVCLDSGHSHWAPAAGTSNKLLDVPAIGSSRCCNNSGMHCLLPVEPGFVLEVDNRSNGADLG